MKKEAKGAAAAVLDDELFQAEGEDREVVAAVARVCVCVP